MLSMWQFAGEVLVQRFDAIYVLAVAVRVAIWRTRKLASEPRISSAGSIQPA